jgi:hypothetical protein
MKRWNAMVLQALILAARLIIVSAEAADARTYSPEGVLTRPQI